MTRRLPDTHEEDYEGESDSAESLLAEFLRWLYEEKEYALCKEHPFGYVPENELNGGELIKEFLSPKT